MKKHFIWIIILLFCQTTLFAQKDILQSDTAKSGVVKFQRFDTSINPRLSANEKDVLKQTLKITEKDSLKLEKTISSGNYTHNVYQQFYKGYKVVGGTYATHGNNGKIESINGFFQKVGNPDIIPKIDEQIALNKVLALIDAKKYGWEDPFTENMYKKQMKDSSATLKPKGELLIIFDDSITNSYRLAYKFHIYAVVPLDDKNVYIDAISGNIIGVENLIRDANVVGTAATLYSKTQSITMDSYSNPEKYRLQETRTTNGKTAQIQTYDMKNGGNYNNVDFSNSSLNWSTANAGLDVHWGTEKVFDYWSSVRNRNSYDNNGGALIGYVHANLSAINPRYTNDNAFWDPTMLRMTYGDGETQFKSVVSLDVIAHEIGHGVNEFTANLGSTYQNQEQDALNEGLSDIWGAVIENWAAPNDPNKHTWEIGEEIMKNGQPCLRSLSNPKSVLCPDTYKSKTYWSSENEPHTNSTILSHWFYLLSQGGSGTNDLGNSYNVSGIGITNAANIVWNAESTQKLQSQSQYADARTAMIQAAREINGGTIGSNDEISVTNAWYAVGVGGQYPTISGPNVVCNNGSNFSLSNSPGNIYWTVSNPGLFSVYPATGNSTTVTSIGGSGAGSATLEARIGSASGTVVAGKVIATCGPISGPDVVCYDGSIFGLNNSPGDIYWTVSDPGLFTVSSAGSIDYITVTRIGTGTGSATLEARGSTSGKVIASTTITTCPAVSISGQDNITYNKPSDYVINNMPSSVNLYWTTSDPDKFILKSVNYNAVQVSMKLPTTGTATYPATLYAHSGSINGPVILSKTIYRDPPPSISAPATVCYNIGSNFYLNCVSSLDAFSWTITPNPGAFSINQINYYSAFITLILPYTGSVFTLDVHLGSVTGPVIATTTITTCQSGASYSSYPNPVFDVLNVEIDSQAGERLSAEIEKSASESLDESLSVETEKSVSASNLDPVFDVRLYDGLGNLLRQAKIKDGSVQFNVYDLPNGIYYLHIYDGSGCPPQMQQIIVNH